MNRIGQVLAVALALLLPAALGAQATMTTQEQKDQNGDYLHRVTTFEGELPEALGQALEQSGLGGAACVSGAMLEQEPTEQLLHLIEGLPPEKAAHITNRSNTRALVALEMGGETGLVGLFRSADGAWTVEVFGPKALLPGRSFAIGVRDVLASVRLYPMARFTVDYPMGDGGMESYGLWCAIGGEEIAPWHVATYEKRDASGKETLILERNFVFWGFREYVVPLTGDGKGEDYPAYVPPFLASMDSIADFPTSGEQARQLGETSMKRFDGTDLAMTAQVNFRKEPTTKSQSLGVLNVGTLAHVLEEKEGKDNPWYHVRIGREEGWVAGNYLRFPTQRDFGMYLSLPLPVARSLAGVSLRLSPSAGAEVVAELDKDTLMHVMATVENGWLYVMVPRGQIGWEMDVDGTSGYLPASEVAEGATAAMVAP